MRRKGEFKRLRDEGTRVIGSSCRFQYRVSETPSPPKSPKLGLTVPKKFGNAPSRNRFKRIVREIFRQKCSFLPPNCEVNISPNDWNQSVNFEKISLDFEKFLVRATSHYGSSQS